jgi:iron(III) transport system substrate-binding protein
MGLRGGWVLLLLAAAASLAACGSSGSSDSGNSGSSGSSSGSITVYSGQHEQTMAALVADFKKRTGVDVKLRSSDEASLANQVLREGSASPADVFVAENPPALTVLERKGLLAPVDAATLAKTPARLNDPQHQWVAVSARSAVLAYNTDAVKSSQPPSALQDLAGSAWDGKVGFAPTETDFQPLISAMVRLHGESAATAWLKSLKAHGKVYDDNEALIAAVNRGEVATGLIDHYYFYRMRDEVGPSKLHTALHYFAPGDAGALVDVSGAAALKSSSHAKAAQRFLAYLVSKPAQQLIATSESYEYPVGSGVPAKRELKPFTQLKPPDISVADLGDGRSALRALQDVGLL